jgi:hypothetical protein
VNHPAVVSLVLRLLVGCYGYMLVMASAGVAACELRKPGECGSSWTQAFTVAGGAASTMWAYITDSPNSSPSSSRRRNGPPTS